MKKLGIIIFLLALLSTFAAAPDLSSCQTISSPGVYTLTQDLSTTATCITVSANDVVLDGDGYSVEGDASGSGDRGVFVNSVDNVTIKNFELISDFTNAIRIVGDQVTVQNNTLSTNTSEVVTTHVVTVNGGSNDVTIANNTIISHTRGDGIHDNTGNNLRLNIEFNTINVTFSSSYYAIALNSLNDSVISSNTIFAMANAIPTSENNNLTISHNSITTHSTIGDGLNLAALTNSLIENNTISTNGSSAEAIQLRTTSEQNTFLNNDLNAVNDLEFLDDTGGAVRHNYLVYNNSFGEIRWTDKSSNGFVENLTFEGRIALGANLTLANNIASLNTGAFTLGKINSSANITLFGLALGSVDQITKDPSYRTTSVSVVGSDCLAGGSCNKLSYAGGVLIFNTTSFSSFKAVEDAPDPVPEWEDYAALLILITVVGGFYAIRNERTPNN